MRHHPQFMDLINKFRFQSVIQQISLQIYMVLQKNQMNYQHFHILTFILFQLLDYDFLQFMVHGEGQIWHTLNLQKT